MTIHQKMFTIFSIAFIHLFFSDISHATPNNADANGHHHNSATSSLPPIILIPGFMASKLYISGNNSEELKEICGGEEEEYENKKVWATAEYIDPKLQKCRFAQLTLTNDGHKSIIKNEGIFVNALGGGKEFGDTSSVKCLFLDGKDEHGNDQCAQSIIDKNDEANFAPLIKWLTENLGYKEGKNLFAAPYDWRFETNNDYLNEYYEELTKLIEKAKKENGKKVLLILHSYGNSIGNYYLNNFKSEEKWQKDHIAATINVAAPFGGAVEVLEEIISGNSGRYFSSMAQFVSNSTVLPFIRSLGSTAAVLPNYWAFKNKKLVEIPFPEEKNAGDEKSWINWIFSIPIKNEIKMANHLNVRKKEKESNIGELLEKIGIPFFKEIYHKTIPKPQEHIKMHCIYGTDLPTPIKYVYGHDISKPPKETINGDGDNTINIESLRVCKEWKTHGNALVGEIKELPKVTHGGILHNEQFYAFVKNIIEIEKEK